MPAMKNKQWISSSSRIAFPSSLDCSALFLPWFRLLLLLLFSRDRIQQKTNFVEINKGVFVTIFPGQRNINTAIPSLHCLRLFRVCLSAEWTANSKHWLTARRWSEREDRHGPNDFLFLSFFRIEKFTMVGVDVKGVLVCDKSGLTLTSNDRSPFHSASSIAWWLLLARDVSNPPGPVARLTELAAVLAGRRSTVCLEDGEK